MRLIFNYDQECIGRNSAKMLAISNMLTKPKRVDILWIYLIKKEMMTASQIYWHGNLTTD